MQRGQQLHAARHRRQHEKRVARACVSWRRPVFAKPDENKESGDKKAKRPYESCAMLQLLRSVVAQEQMWQQPQSARGGMSVTQRRLLATGRTTIIKKEPMKLNRMVEDCIDLTGNAICTPDRTSELIYSV